MLSLDQPKKLLYVICHNMGAYGLITRMVDKACPNEFEFRYLYTSSQLMNRQPGEFNILLWGNYGIAPALDALMRKEIPAKFFMFDVNKQVIKQRNPPKKKEPFQLSSDHEDMFNVGLY